ncbi:anthranilate synthase component I [Solemya pervernicosa gill symbiont]|uniref:Anthranilate synthase component 1 n=2 Tax=Gammaproteobacteria incertae sedis TaxID=118884 RepID=A0A1T2L2B2_9GAMM|nr:anthranilate synthase component I [Candidatus Reidiella endopervernicosa]OOZ39204.1 anthranilate synthase component I [Solemya pervernicosa gill symbiont]QKQ28045.1 anthranilate synthase component I [Candidatus Reidiella endopervernicosa]
MNQQQFNALAAEGYNRIPLMREVLADLDTPLSTYLKLADAPYTYLLESVQGGEKWGRYSIIGLPARTVLSVKGHEVTVSCDHVVLEQSTEEDPLAFIEQFQARYKVPEVDGLPKFTGGLVGYFGYDTVRYIEPRLGESPNEDQLGNPDILLMLSDEVVVFDNLSGKLFVVVHADPSDAAALQKGETRLSQLVRLLDEPLKRAPHVQSRKVSEDDFVSGFTQQGFEEAVAKSKQYITDGDIMQVVLSQRLSIPYEAPPLDLYRSLRSLNPSPYMYFLNLESFHIVGSSPEILTRYEDDKVTVRPIAGTRPRGKDEAEDRALEKELLADPKELAEHLMLIDLGRNDVGRIAETGSVELTEEMVIERYSHVMHIVSNVEGDLKKGMSAMDALRATFPAGTVSGAAKVRAMEIIDELEPVKRGVYAGSVGYLGWHGNMDTAIAIRTAVIQNRTLYMQAGAGIVYDSVPRNEWDETMNKSRAVFRAAEMAAKGLDNAQHR